MSGRVVVVGLGPAGADLVLPAARRALERVPVRYARTRRHPAATELAAAGIEMASFDDRYESGSDLSAVYAGIVDALIAAASEHGEIVYAVPGSPTVAEHTVVALHERAAVAGVEVEVIPGLSFAELAWARLGLDSFRGGHVVDAHNIATSAAGLAGPLLIAQCDSVFVLSDVKLVLLESLDPDTPITVLSRLGLADESVTRVALAELDRVVTPDHLTSLFVDTGGAAVAGELAALVALTERLRGPGGCPWDAEQTHHSLARHLLEEAYEVAEAIDGLPASAPGGDEPIPAGAYDALEDELGDLLFQVVIHSVLAREAGAFTIADVARGIHDKLVRRHPHVFGTVSVGGSDDVVRNWEQIKRDEKGTGSLVSGLTTGLPSLLGLPKLFRKADSIGLDPAAGSLARAERALRVLAGPVSDDSDLGERAVADVLAAVVAISWERGVDPEAALRG
ncbi:MAG TPA: MazG nucleotide pyrophosphohydrolase domain-containing protein, partial [Acidimicrobiia bacterium]